MFRKKYKIIIVYICFFAIVVGIFSYFITIKKSQKKIRNILSHIEINEISKKHIWKTLPKSNKISNIEIIPLDIGLSVKNIKIIDKDSILISDSFGKTYLTSKNKDFLFDISEIKDENIIFEKESGLIIGSLNKDKKDKAYRTYNTKRGLYKRENSLPGAVWNMKITDTQKPYVLIGTGARRMYVYDTKKYKRKRIPGAVLEIINKGSEYWILCTEISAIYQSKIDSNKAKITYIPTDYVSNKKIIGINNIGFCSYDNKGFIVFDRDGELAFKKEYSDKEAIKFLISPNGNYIGVVTKEIIKGRNKVAVEISTEVICLSDSKVVCKKGSILAPVDALFITDEAEIIFCDEKNNLILFNKNSTNPKTIHSLNAGISQTIQDNYILYILKKNGQIDILSQNY